MQMLRELGVLMFCFVLSVHVIHAQKGWEVGGELGLSHYFGDLNTSYDLTELGPSAGVGVRYNFGHRVCVKSALHWGYIYGDDKDSQNVFERSRNLNFKTHIVDLSVFGEFNFLPYTHGSIYEYYTPYLLLGVTAAYYNPYTSLNGDTHFLRPLGTEGQRRGEEYSPISMAIIFGGGVKFDINYKWSINIEYGMRHMFTDYLDDVSKTYANESTLLTERGPVAAALHDRSGELNIGVEGRQRGDIKRNDQYGFLGIGIMRYFGQVECPNVSKRQAESWL